ncbi:integrator complex subunit 9-like [Amphiura filiformis]|uniref:integrator complex subunit 9-like n=1 Tax=Amphiura filiformis TaxID=82378 RepID=UPI003B215D1B
MKLYCLSENPNAPCLLLTFKGTSIMLDCALDLSPLMHFLPLTLVPSARLSKLATWKSSDNVASKALSQDLRECGGQVFVDSEPEVCVPEIGIVDMSTVDVILISNHHNMLALPFITEYSGFKGTIYATEPTLQIGRQMMEELVEYMERVPKRRKSTQWKKPNILKLLPASLKDALYLSSWKKCYTKHDINSCMSKIQKTSFGEKLPLYGALTMVPMSSGFCLGSSNWVIQSQFEKIVYMSGSSFLTTHSTPISQEPLKNPDILLLTGVTQTPTHNPDSMLGEFCSNLTVTIKNGGSVLVPCYPSGVIYDLFECLSGYMDSVGLMQTPMYFISPVADSSLAYAQIFSEWLCAPKQSRVYLPEPPFPHAELIKNGRLEHFSSLHGDFSSQFKTPCVVFAGHPSLRCGDAVHFIELWGKSSNNTVIFIEPGFPYLEALAPFQPLSMKACYCPIDTAMSYAQANKMIKDLKPLHVVVPNKYQKPPVSQPLRTDLVIEADPAPMSFHRGEVLNLPIRRHSEKIELTPELANSLAPTEVKPGILVSTVTGILNARDNRFILEELPRPPSNGASQSPVPRKRKRDDDLSALSGVHPKQYVYGTLDLEEFVQSLIKHGIPDVKVEETASGHIVLLAQSEDTIIQIEEGSTHIFCDGNEPLRRKLKDALISCLPTF